MIHGYDLHIVPKDPDFRPTNEKIAALVRFLAEQLQITETFTVDGEEELPMKDAIDHLRAAAKSHSGGTEATVSLAGTLIGTLFGREPDEDENDELYWAEELKIQLNGAPFPYADWEYEDAHCPKCNVRLAQIRDLLDELRVSGKPVPCACGARTAPSELKMTSGVRLAQLSIAFTGNKGWYHEVDEDRDAFKDGSFLPALEELLGVPLDVLAIST
jgi:hypothetical protein